jgi:hypothetical protein
MNGAEIFAPASSIKIPIRVELYRQAQDNGRARLADLYKVQLADQVPDSDILLGPTPVVARLTNRDPATITVAVSDNSATNVLIFRYAATASPGGITPDYRPGQRGGRGRNRRTPGEVLSIDKDGRCAAVPGAVSAEDLDRLRSRSRGALPTLIARVDSASRVVADSAADRMRLLDWGTYSNSAMGSPSWRIGTGRPERSW